MMCVRLLIRIGGVQLDMVTKPANVHKCMKVQNKQMFINI